MTSVQNKRFSFKSVLFKNFVDFKCCFLLISIDSEVSYKQLDRVIWIFYNSICQFNRLFYFFNALEFNWILDFLLELFFCFLLLLKTLVCQNWQIFLFLYFFMILDCWQFYHSDNTYGRSFGNYFCFIN